MKDGCWDCVLKHLGDAVVNLTESYLGYPEHMADVVGNINQASEEAFEFAPDFAEQLRFHRRRLTHSLIAGEAYKPPLRDLFMFACTLAKLHATNNEMPLPNLPEELRLDYVDYN